MFEIEFIDALPNDPYQAAHAMCRKFFEVDDTLTSFPERVLSYDNYVEAYAAIEAILESINIPFSSLKLGVDKSTNITRIRNFFSNINKKIEEKVLSLNLSRAREKYKLKFGIGLIYQFSDGDLKRVQTLINELRDVISESELFDAHHKERVLNKLEGLQKELHKKMSSLANFWDLMGDAGVALGKFGKDAKPFVDRVKEILQIIWRTQVRAEELPSATPLPLLSHGQTEVKEPE